MAAGADAVAQSELTALTVNNILGFNQVVNGLNLSSGSDSADGMIGAGASVGADQANISSQFRGSPNQRWKAPTFLHAPPPQPD